MTLQLEATKTAILNRDYDKLNEVIEVEKTKVAIPTITSIDYENYIQEELGNLLIPYDIPYPNEDVYAVKTVGNGNCLFNSISYLLCQSADLVLTLRTLTAAELFINATKYTNHPKFVNCLDLPEVTFAENNLWSLLLRDDASSRMNVSRTEAVEIEASNTANNFTWSGILDILALSSVIKTKIWCCYPECNSVIRPLMNGCVKPLSVEPDINAMLMILWSRDGQFDNTPNLPFEPNHFVPVIYLRPININYNHDKSENRNNTETESSIPATKQDQAPKKKQKGAGLYNTKFDKDWSKKFPFIQMGSTKHHYWCTVCRVENDCSHQGKTDIIRHVNGQGHQQKVKDLKSSHSLLKFAEPRPSTHETGMNKLETQARRAEVKVATCMAKHIIPLAFADPLSHLIKEIFTDSDIAKKYSSAKTKTTCIINGALKPHFQEWLVSFMQQHPFTLSIGGSNDTELQKMNPITVKMFDVNEIRHQFLDMCTTTGTKCGAAETIFVKMNSVMERHKIPWNNCVALSVDNATH